MSGPASRAAKSTTENAPLGTAPARKGASRAADVTPALHAALSRGEIASATLTEGLALDQALLVRTVFPALSAAAQARAQAIAQQGILQRMAAMGALLHAEFGDAATATAQAHGSDTVRGWACFMQAARPDLALAARLAAVRPLADDPHFGVREWAWLALRPHLARELPAAIAGLAAWTAEPSERLRRFASEALRPRGVWCAHIAALKQAPQQGLPILAPLRADPSVYVQDSVANWLNDAAKDQPGWVQDLCAQWRQGPASAATERICRRALRRLAPHSTP